MSLKALISKTEFGALAEDIQAHYGETVGDSDSYNLQVTAVSGIELSDTTALKKALQQERKNVETAKKDLKVFDGLDPKAAKEALGKIDELAKWDPDKKLAESKLEYEKQLSEKFEADKRTLVIKHESDMGALNTKMTTLSGQLQNEMISSAATKAISEAGGSQELLKPILIGSTRVKQLEDGRHVVEVIGDDGLARLSPKPGSSDLMTIEEKVSEMRENDKFSRAFDGSNASGSGAVVSEGSSSSSFKLTFDEAKDPHKYRAAKDAADKAGKELQVAEWQPKS